MPLDVYLNRREQLCLMPVQDVQRIERFATTTTGVVMAGNIVTRMKHQPRARVATDADVHWPRRGGRSGCLSPPPAINPMSGEATR